MNTKENRAIDIYNKEKAYEKALANIEKSTEVSEVNKRYIIDFLYDCQIGKTVLKRAKKRIKQGRLSKYLCTLKQITRFLGKDFDKVEQKDMENFIRKLDSNTLTSIAPDGKIIRHNYTEWTRHDYKITIRKFYKWLWGNNREFPELVSWIDTHVEESDPPSLSIKEIRSLADHASNIKGKAMLWALFETGARISELLNVRLHHIKDKEKYYLVRIEVSKTFKRTVPVFEGYNYIREWISYHPDKDNADSQLFPVTYAALRKWLKRLGQKALKKNVHPHLLRHSYATWLAGKKVGRYQMCKLMGWAMSSDMPDRYIDRQGVIEEETLQSIRGDELTKAQTINSDLKKELTELQYKFSQITEQIEHKKKSDGFLDKLMQDTDVQKIICQKIKELGLESELGGL